MPSGAAHQAQLPVLQEFPVSPGDFTASILGWFSLPPTPSPSSLPDLKAMASPELPVSPCCFLDQAPSLSCTHNPTSLSVLPLWLPHRNVLLQPDGLSVSPWGISDT